MGWIEESGGRRPGCGVCALAPPAHAPTTGVNLTPLRLHPAIEATGPPTGRPHSSPNPAAPLERNKNGRSFDFPRFRLLRLIEIPPNPSLFTSETQRPFAFALATCSSTKPCSMKGEKKSEKDSRNICMEKKKKKKNEKKICTYIYINGEIFFLPPYPPLRPPSHSCEENKTGIKTIPAHASTPPFHRPPQNRGSARPRCAKPSPRAGSR